MHPTEVTILFAEILSQNASDESSHRVLRARLEAIVRRYDGSIVQAPPGEEAIVALFGAPTAQPEDPERAIRAALTMQASLASPDKSTPAKLVLRMGLSTAQATMRLAEQGQYEVEGAALYLARLLARAASPNEILISPESHRRVAGQFELYPLQPVLLDGQKAPISPHRVQGERWETTRASRRAVENFESRLVGRAAELQRLQAIFNRTEESGQLQVVTVLGDAGLGKSSLLRAFSEWIEAQPETVRFFKGRANPQISTQPYALIRDIFAFRFGIREGEAVMARAKLEQGIRKFMGAEGTEKAHLIGHLLGFDFSESPHIRGSLSDARQLRERAFRAITLFLEALTSERRDAVRLLRAMPGHGDRPLVVILLQDIHWADDGSLDLLEYLVQSCRQVPLLLLATARARLWSSRPSWGERWPESLHTLLEVAPLSFPERQQLATALLHQLDNPSPDLMSLLINQSEGSPLHMEELLKVLLEEGVITAPPGSARWSLDEQRLAETSIPPTLTGIMERRLGRLPTLEREVLQRAAVVGRIFWDQAVAWLLDDAPAAATYEVQVALRGAQEQGLVAERQSPTFEGVREFVFRQGLLQEVAYASLSEGQRQSYHAQVAAWLVPQSGERGEEIAGQIARHYELSGHNEEAAHWYGRAAKRAQDSSLPQTALTYYEKALALLPDASKDAGGPFLTLLEGLGQMLRQQVRYEEAITTFHTLIEAAQEANDAIAQMRALNNLAMTHDIQRDHRNALKYAEEAEQMAAQAGEVGQSELAGALWLAGVSHFRLGHLDAAKEKAEQSLTLSTSLNAQRVMARSHSLLGWIHDSASRYEEAGNAMRRALTLFRRMEDRQGISVMLNDLGVSASAQGDYRAALPLFQEALTLAREVSVRSLETSILTNLGGIHVGLGDFGGAENELRETLRLADESKQSGSSESYRYLAEALLGQGQMEEAWGAALEALRLGHRSGRKEHMASAWRTLGTLLCQGSAPQFSKGFSIDEETSTLL
ncbi:MAG: tetratricopeptide repeat protein, partial [Ardenticatenales bacterium]|nr:tetratricopeptide repeat protein [Ardenticatenales bacterium]